MWYNIDIIKLYKNNIIMKKLVSFLVIFLVIIVTAIWSYSCYSTCDSFGCFGCTIFQSIFFLVAILSLVKLLISFMVTRDRILRNKQIKYAVLLFAISITGFLLNSMHG